MARRRIPFAVAIGIVVATTGVGHAAAQDTPTTPGASKAFDVVSVHTNRSGTTQTRFDRTPAGVTIVNLPLRAIIQFAYGVSQPSRLTGVPDWVGTERFDIVARGAVAGIDDFRAMMQALLADRFKLATHTEQRSLPIFNLVLARTDRRLGPSLKPSSLDCPPPGRGRTGQPPAAVDATTQEGCGVRPGGPGELNLAGLAMERFASMLSVMQQRPVIDGTGLTGTYDIHLLFAPDPMPERPVDPVTDGRPSLLTALREQLGLKLEPGRQQQDVVVIDRVSRPDEN
jgi:uncharacterized protein (TIGR03435 family)